MKVLRFYNLFFFVLGIVLIIYGWTFNFPQPYHTSEDPAIIYDRIVNQNIKKYIFMTSGLIAIVLSSVLHQIIKKFEEIHSKLKDHEA